MARANPARSSASASRTATVAWSGARGRGHRANTPAATTKRKTAATTSLLIAQRLRRRRGRHPPRRIDAGEQRRQQRQGHALQQDLRRGIDGHRPAERAAIDDEDEHRREQQAARHGQHAGEQPDDPRLRGDQAPHLPRGQSERKSTRLNSSHGYISYAVFCLKKKKKNTYTYS